MNKKLNVLIVFGGKSAEHEISVLSARSIAQALPEDEFNLCFVGICRNGNWVTEDKAKEALQKGLVEDQESNVFIRPGNRHNFLTIIKEDGQQKTLNIDIVLPVLHGTFGEDGTIQGLFEMSEIPYVGAGVLASALGMDKSMIKDVWKEHGLPVLPSLTYLRSKIEENIDVCAEEIGKELGFPCFVKPANSGSSVGITRACNNDELKESLKLAIKFDRKILVEKACISPREIEIAVLGNDVPECSVPGEITYTSQFYDYQTKYLNEGNTQLLIPAPIDQSTVDRITETAKEAWRAVYLNGLGRIDFLLDKNGNIWLNEVNTFPGFTQFSMYPKLWEASGVKYAELLKKLINLAIERFDDNQRNLFKP
ncbi:D-alanine--D-alanine ligase [bacterium]|nr:D-alanine--D-alanine ligase [bacterium]